MSILELFAANYEISARERVRDRTHGCNASFFDHALGAGIVGLIRWAIN